MPSQFSISDALSGVDEKEKKEVQPVDSTNADPKPGLPQEDFSQEKLDELWQQYLAKLQASGRARLHGSLSNKALEKKEDNTISITLGNQIQQSALHEIKPEFLPFLREKLQNFYLHIEVVLSAKDDAAKLDPYSDEERYEYLRKKNPKIAELRNRLGMDFD